MKKEKERLEYVYNGITYVESRSWDVRFYEEESPHGYRHLVDVMYYLFDALIDNNTLSFILVRENELRPVSVPLSCAEKYEEDIVWKKVWNEISPRVIVLENARYYHGKLVRISKINKIRKEKQKNKNIEIKKRLGKKIIYWCIGKNKYLPLEYIDINKYKNKTVKKKKI